MRISHAKRGRTPVPCPNLLWGVDSNHHGPGNCQASGHFNDPTVLHRGPDAPGANPVPVGDLIPLHNSRGLVHSRLHGQGIMSITELPLDGGRVVRPVASRTLKDAGRVTASVLKLSRETVFRIGARSHSLLDHSKTVPSISLDLLRLIRFGLGALTPAGPHTLPNFRSVTIPPLSLYGQIVSFRSALIANALQDFGVAVTALVDSCRALGRKSPSTALKNLRIPRESPLPDVCLALLGTDSVRRICDSLSNHGLVLITGLVDRGLELSIRIIVLFDRCIVALTEGHSDH